LESLTARLGIYRATFMMHCEHRRLESEVVAWRWWHSHDDLNTFTVVVLLVYTAVFAYRFNCFIRCVHIISNT
jgi:hypothetical protein